MGSEFSKKASCCMTCGKYKKQKAEEAINETSETQPIIQASEEAPAWMDHQPPAKTKEASERHASEAQPTPPDKLLPVETVEEAGEAQPAEDAEQVIIAEATEGLMEALLAAVETTAAPETAPKQEMGEAEATPQAKEALQGAEAWPASGITQAVEAVAESRVPDAQHQPRVVQLQLPQENKPQNSARATEQPAAAQGLEAPPDAEIALGKNKPPLAEDHSEKYAAVTRVQGTGGSEAAVVTLQPPVKNWFAHTIEKTRSQSVLQVAQEPTEATSVSQAMEVTPKSITETQFTLQLSNEVSPVNVAPSMNALEPVNKLNDLARQETQSGEQLAQKAEQQHAAEPLEIKVDCQESRADDGVLALVPAGAEAREGSLDASDEGQAPATANPEQQQQDMDQPVHLPEEVLPSTATTCLSRRGETKSAHLETLVPQAFENQGEGEAEKTLERRGEMAPGLDCRPYSIKPAPASGAPCPPK
ncbi:von Willebrand factor A domain-containing protein DDB_G0286969-like [Alligator sinensis]|uniref:von Willebrand factor A domain-containing protein DDB_G0286969-like n=1 Tax=Alligator sinensis TaxID=38654 RepID=A0A1U7RWU4_ALLSI|nr:von Willebrand factor A domain-containing protein DDB_G0286969-like [Alligator sinensis]XP_006020462.1 von Willebrand factor A domain-containing protein DDB_G0286969-like [Alligator sinensis]